MADMIVSGLVQYHPDLAGLLMPIDDITQHPDNYNNGDLDEICVSIEVNGMYRPIEVQTSTGYILAGNSTWEACKTLGASEIPVIKLDVDDTTADRILAVDNQAAWLAVPDPALQLHLLERITARDSLLGTGYKDHDLEALRRLANPPPPVDLTTPSWPTICTQVPPATKRAYLTMTETAGGDTERFHLLMQMAGWDPE